MPGFGVGFMERGWDVTAVTESMTTISGQSMAQTVPGRNKNSSKTSFFLFLLLAQVLLIQLAGGDYEQQDSTRINLRSTRNQQQEVVETGGFLDS